MGHDPRFKYVVLAFVLIQFIMIYTVRDVNWTSVLLLAYFLGGTINHSLSLAIHEISHNLAFGHSRPLANRFLGFFANLPIGIPVSISFRKYHLEHHRYQGDAEKDVDIPSDFECKYFYNTFTKVVWVLLQPFFYGLRPLLLRPKPLQGLELANIIIQFAFDAMVWYFFGTKSVVYMISGTLLATGLHPMAGHFISEHYIFKEGYETYSYYGPMNLLTFNVGYHNEHHDFPGIPGSRLPEVRKIAPEFYENLPFHTSWVMVIWKFITDPKIGPYARVKRMPVKEEEADKKLAVVMNGTSSEKDAFSEGSYSPSLFNVLAVSKVHL